MIGFSGVKVGVGQVKAGVLESARLDAIRSSDTALATVELPTLTEVVESLSALLELVQDSPLQRRSGVTLDALEVMAHYRRHLHALRAAASTTS